MSNINWENKGKRVKLLYTDDPFTKLKPGDEGTYEFLLEHLNHFKNQHSILWDNGSHLMMVHGDDFKFIETKKED